MGGLIEPWLWAGTGHAKSGTTASLWEMLSEEILKTPLGLKVEEEKGLNESDYIVPGAGGVGEVLNNSFVDIS